MRRPACSHAPPGERSLHAATPSSFDGVEASGDGRQFVANAFVESAGHKRTIAHGGILRDGADVRVHVHSGDILRIDVRYGIYGSRFRSRVQNLGIKEVVIARRSPWQNPYVERVIGTLQDARGGPSTLGGASGGSELGQMALAGSPVVMP
jgi:hypothetical protein